MNEKIPPQNRRGKGSTILDFFLVFVGFMLGWVVAGYMLSR